MVDKLSEQSRTCTVQLDLHGYLLGSNYIIILCILYVLIISFDI